MTLITRLAIPDFSIMCGEGCTIDYSGLKLDEKLRKVYINSTFCVAFAGEIWTNNDFEKEDTYVPLLIEDFMQKDLLFDEGIKLCNSLIKILKKDNKNLKCELFISHTKDNIIDNYYVTTQKEEIYKQNINPTEFNLNFSDYDKKTKELINKLFHLKWHQYFKTHNDNRLFFNQKIHTIESVADFLIYFYKTICSYTPFSNLVVGNSIDIVTIEKNSIKFFKKENFSFRDNKLRKQ